MKHWLDSGNKCGSLSVVIQPVSHIFSIDDDSVRDGDTMGSRSERLLEWRFACGG